MAINTSFMSRGLLKALDGMNHNVPVSILQGMDIYRFGDFRDREDDWYGAGWWFSKSVYDALLTEVRAKNISLSLCGRQSLAVAGWWGRPNSRRNNMDLLISARVGESLDAWSGTPMTVTPGIIGPGEVPQGMQLRVTGANPTGGLLIETQRMRRPMSGQHGFRHEPDRRFTQMYIPGLEKPRDKKDPVPWMDFIPWNASVRQGGPPVLTCSRVLIEGS